MRNRVSYPAEFLLVGPSPATGYFFIHYTGLLGNFDTNLVQSHNLLQQINRAQNAGFSLAPARTEVKQLGKRTLVSHPNVNSPDIQLDFEWLLNGVANDARVGLNVNFAQFQFPHSGGTPKYADNFSVNLLSGLMGRQLTQETGDPYFPLAMRDNRNIFLVRCAESDQMITHGKEILTEPDFTQRGTFPGVTGFEVLAFGNCYLENYKTQGAVNSIPKSSVSWVCENAAFYLSGSGCLTPAVNTRTRQRVNDNKFVIPEIYNQGGPYILNPGDIILNIASTGDSLSGLGINFNNIAITNYQIGMDFRREQLSSIGYKLPLDRQVTFPVFVDLNFGMTIGDTTSGTFIDLLNIDSGYNIDLKLRNPLCCPPFIHENTNPRQSGPIFTGEGHTAIHYAFRDAKFMGMNYNTAIGQNMSANLSFRGEINPDVAAKGFYISGLLGIEKLESFLLDDDGYAVFDENNMPIVGHLNPLY